MNILIPHQWLLEHLETNASPKEIQRLLSLSGPSIERIYDKNGDSVYDIEVTTNRVDGMSVRGIAREAAVILNHAGVSAKLKPLFHNPKFEIRNSKLLPIIVNNENLCPRITCVVLSNVKRNPTPEWMADGLKLVDINVHDAVIDITNYITHELGHPCHAFDYDKIMALGGSIIVKEAEKGKKFTTLDNVEYETVGGEVVFENEAGKIIDLPGIKGTANSAIDDNTTNVLLWLESIDAKKVRFASMSHAIRTTAAQLNEKKVDPELMPVVLQRGIELYQQLTDAQVASEIVDIYPTPKKIESIQISVNRIQDYLGVELPIETIRQILTELECNVALNTNHKSQTTLSVTPPSFRPDLTIPADIIEEIARIYGYHNLPSKIMDTTIPLIIPDDVNFDLENRVKHFLADIGWYEVYTYSMVSEELAKMSGYELNKHFKIQNPLTDDRVYLRNSLVPSLNEVIDNNPTEKEISVFEIANEYRKFTKPLPVEALTLGMVSTKSFRAVKGDVEALLKQFHINNFDLRINDPQIPNVSQSAVICIQKGGGTIELGTIAVMKNGRISVKFGMKGLIMIAKKYPNYQPSPKTAQIVEDLTFTLPEKTLSGEVLKAIPHVSEFIVLVELKDVYKQNHTFSITYLDKTKNMTGEDVEPIRKEIVKKLSEQFSAALVGQI